jgi:Flp pilus assembly protein TadD
VNVSIPKLAACLILASALGGCSAQAPVRQPNVGLIHTIHDAVPNSWREAADSTEDILPLEVSSDLRQFVHSTGRSNDDARERILALTQAIIAPDGVGLKYNPAGTYTAAEAFQAGAGNCLGFSNLLIASARELGLNASFELVTHGLRWDKVDDVLFGSLHVRVVSFAGGRRMVFDFYPLPIESWYSTKPLSDDEALAHHLNNLAVRSMQDGDGASAYALISKAIETSPGIAFLWSNLGILLSRNEFDALAESAFKEALLISPETLSAMSNLQRLYFRQDRHAEATEIMHQLEDYRASNPYYHFWLGQKAYELGEFRSAVGHIKGAIRRKENEPEFYILLSKSYNALGMQKAALRASRKAETFTKPKANSYSIRSSQLEIGTDITRK